MAEGRHQSAGIGAVAGRGQPDPWGVRAWIAKHRITTTATGQRGQIGPAVNGYMVEDVAEEVAHAADLDPSWRGNWDAIGAWMRDDIGLTGAALQRSEIRPGGCGNRARISARSRCSTPRFAQWHGAQHESRHPGAASA